MSEFLSFRLQHDLSFQSPAPEPEPEPVPVRYRPDPLSVKLAELSLGLDKLLVEEAFATCAEFRRLVKMARTLSEKLQETLPGFEIEPKDDRRANSIEQVIEFCQSVNLPKSDAEWFWYKCEGNGWTVNKRAIRNWKMTVRAWQRAYYFPSQKPAVGANGRVINNGARTLPNIAERDLMRHAAKLL